MIVFVESDLDYRSLEFYAQNWQSNSITQNFNEKSS